MQIYGVDYFTTYLPVAKLTSFCTILVIAVHQDWDIESFDFNGAYLNGELMLTRRSICRHRWGMTTIGAP